MNTIAKTQGPPVDKEKIRAIVHEKTGNYFNPNTNPPRWEQVVWYKEADLVIGYQPLGTPWEERKELNDEQMNLPL